MAPAIIYFQKTYFTAKLKSTEAKTDITLHITNLTQTDTCYSSV